MRVAGRKRAVKEILSDPGLVGGLKLSYEGSPSHKVLSFCEAPEMLQRPGFQKSPKSEHLFEPELIGFMGGGLRLRGFEKVEGAAVLQEWLCEVTNPDERELKRMTRELRG